MLYMCPKQLHSKMHRASGVCIMRHCVRVCGEGGEGEGVRTGRNPLTQDYQDPAT